MTAHPFYQEPLAWPGRERRAQRLATEIRQLPPDERIWSVVDLLLLGMGADLILRIEWLCDLIPAGRPATW